MPNGVALNGKNEINMKTSIFYVFEPTKMLQDLAAAVNLSDLARSSVWIVDSHDRTGAEYSKDDLLKAHWDVFIANLFGDNDADNLKELRRKCQALGRNECWSILEVKLGGEAKDLVEEAQSARSFLIEQGVSS